MVGSFKIPLCKKLFDILYISLTKDWCERTAASTDLQMLRLFLRASLKKKLAKGF